MASGRGRHRHRLGKGDDLQAMTDQQALDRIEQELAEGAEPPRFLDEEDRAAAAREILQARTGEIPSKDEFWTPRRERLGLMAIDPGELTPSRDPE